MKVEGHAPWFVLVQAQLGTASVHDAVGAVLNRIQSYDTETRVAEFISCERAVELPGSYLCFGGKRWPDQDAFSHPSRLSPEEVEWVERVVSAYRAV